MRKNHNRYSFWHKELLKFDSGRKKEKRVKKKKIFSIPEENRKVFKQEKKKNFPEQQTFFTKEKRDFSEEKRGGSVKNSHWVLSGTVGRASGVKGNGNGALKKIHPEKQEPEAVKTKFFSVISGKGTEKKILPAVYCGISADTKKSPLKTGTLAAMLNRVISTEKHTVFRGGTTGEFSNGSICSEEKIYSVVRQYIKENLPVESI